MSIRAMGHLGQQGMVGPMWRETQGGRGGVGGWEPAHILGREAQSPHYHGSPGDRYASEGQDYAILTLAAAEKAEQREADGSRSTWEDEVAGEVAERAPGRALSEGPAMAETYPIQRILMAPGPSNVHPRVLQAMMAPLAGHRDPEFLAIMDETADLLRQVFVTQNVATFSLPATGGAGMEASLVNLLEPGDTAVIGVAGFFAARMVEIAQRCGARTVVVQGEWGKALDPDDFRKALQQHPAKVVALVHGETSTGVSQPLAEIARLAHENGALVAVDAVATLGGVELSVDAWQLDITYSGSQKCLSAPPGLAPITISPAAMNAIRSRRSKVQSWYLDLSLHERYWSPEHAYHHTAPVLNIYALREALRLVMEEGLRERYDRHKLHSQALCAGLEAMGLQLFVDPPYRLPSVVTVRVPEGVNEARVRGALLKEYGVQISGGLGDYAGRMWRIGVMGYSASRPNVLLLLGALEATLQREGHRLSPGAGLAAAEQVYHGTAG